MHTVEILAMVGALLLMLASLTAKAITSQLISRMQYQIDQVAAIRHDALSQLKRTEHQGAIVLRNKEVLASKRAKLRRRLKRLKKEVAQIKREKAARQPPVAA